jgi:glutamate synthase (ferredoxin)
MVRLERVSEKHDIQELKTLIENHAAATGSPKAQRILDAFEACLPLFKKVIPVDYDRMLRAIARAEARGLSR